tara:strand:- start:65 stop:598 length:534 start_codon:yes stop_codon:yes gene_type:complete
MSYQEDLILSIYNRGEPGLAMGNIPPGKGGSPGQPYEAPKEDPKNPYVPAPKPKLAGAPNFPGGGFTTTSGAFVDLSGEAYYLDNGELIPTGGYDPAIHGDLIPEGGPDMRVMNNQNMMIAQGPELGGTGRLLTIGEYNQAVDTGFSNLMSSDMTKKDFEDYLRIKETAKRQMLDGV